jgi:antitoxin ChpS
MPTVTISSKHQITLPMEIVRGLGLKPGGKLVVELIDDHLVLLPEPESWVDYFKGSLKGVYGSTVEEIDKYIDDLRDSHERWEWKQKVRVLIENDDDLLEVVEKLREFPRHRASLSQLRAAVSEPERSKIPLKGSQAYGKFNQKLWVALEMLKEAGAVHELPAEGEEPRYLLVREFARD